MADAVTVTKLKEAGTKVVYLLTNHSDATGETNVAKIVASTLASYTSGGTLTINKIAYSVSGSAAVKVIFDGATDKVGAILAGNGVLDLSGNMSAVMFDSSTTPVGQILVSTVGFISNSTYTLVIECTKVGFLL